MKTAGISVDLQGSRGYLIVTRTHVVLITDKQIEDPGEGADCGGLRDRGAHNQDRLRLVADTMKRLGITSSVMEAV